MIASYRFDAVLAENLVHLHNVGCLENNVCLVCLNRKTVHIFNVDSAFVDSAEKLLKASYLVRYLNDGNVGKKGRKSVFGELFLTYFGSVNYKAEQTELGGIGKTERENVYAVGAKNVENLAKASRSVFNKYG